MKTFILVLTLAAFLESSFLPINLVLLLLISRVLVSSDRSNYYFCLYSGILLGVLSSINIGFYSLIFLVFIQIIESLKKSRLSTHPVIVLIIFILANLVLTVAESLVFHQQLEFKTFILSSLAGLPIYLIVRVWEERFTPKRGIKLKI